MERLGFEPDATENLIIPWFQKVIYSAVTPYIASALEQPTVSLVVPPRWDRGTPGRGMKVLAQKCRAPL